MKKLLIFALAGALGTTPVAAETVLDALGAWQADPAIRLEAADIVLEDFKWIARPLVIFADSPLDPLFGEQLELLSQRPADLLDRDVVVIVDTDPSARSDLRRQLRPRGFMMVLIGKDGEVKLRKPFPWNTRELGRSIDKMPLRQQEIRDGNRPGG